ncbi:unnamed protein product [Penicillium salamii]|uniref:RBR-type E3 ubiquitin transferase n=1 Tax=Penicillium salamii TaxID=1612424 RepID=A0A9W4IUL6_9EURO|nr:unnamed protein product [Penicillium salamii]
MGTAMSMEFDADMEEVLDQYERGILTELSKLSAAVEDLDCSSFDSDSDTLPGCVCCQENFPAGEMVQAQCSHFYCSECLTDLFQKSLHDDSLCPLQCCAKQIKVADAKNLIGHTLIAKYEYRLAEILDPDKTYCSDPICSQYIPPKKSGSHRVVCKCKCGVETCRRCKQKAHGDSEDCARYFDRLLEDLATTEGWKRCPECSRLIELEKGCFHIICVCGSAWCYLCTKNYKKQGKSCECPAWDEALILNYGEVV